MSAASMAAIMVGSVTVRTADNDVSLPVAYQAAATRELEQMIETP
jgi:hypothetical protein